MSVATLLALGDLAPAVWANGAPYYLDPNGGTTDGFDVGSGTYAQSSVQWNPNTNGIGTLVAFPSTSPYYQMTFGNGGTTLPDLSGTFTVTLDRTRFHGVAINSSGIDLTLAGSGNYYNSSSGDTWTVVAGSSLTVNTPRQQFDAGATAILKGLNWNKAAITFLGGGTINFPTPLACNAGTALQTEDMTNGIINFQMDATPPSGAGTYSGGFRLQAGSLNFASAGSANQFYGFTAGNNFTIGGGTFIDNTSGSEITLNFAGGGGIGISGNFTFTGSSSLDFGAAPVTNTSDHTITVVANTLAIGGGISGPGAGLTKAGNGTLLLYGVSTYSGNTVVNAGTLALTNGGSISASAQLNVNHATLDLTGLTAPYLTNAAVGLTNATLALSVPQMVTTNIAAVNLNLGGATNPVNIASLPVVTSYPARFHLISYTTLTGAFNLGLSNLPAASPAFAGYLTNVAASGSVDLVLVAGPAPAKTLTWTGADPSNPNNWDVLTSMNWLDTGNGNIPASFNQNDLARFDDTATGSTSVSVVQNVMPSILTVSNNAHTYIFNGGGSISGPVALTKQGSGTLLLQETGDSFTGGINASAGTVIIDTDSSGVTGGATISSGATLQLGTNDTAGVLPSGTVTANGTLIFNRADNFTVASTIVGGGTVSEIASNIVTLSGTSSGNWATLIQNGTLQAANNTSLGTLPGGAVTVTNGGTFDVGANGTANNVNFGAKQFNIAGDGVGFNGAIVNSGTVPQQNAFQTIVLTADATIGGPTRWDLRGGTPLLNLAGYTLTKTNVNQISMVSPHVTSGNIVIQQGILSFESTPNFDAGASTITVNNGGYVGQYKDTAGSFTRAIVLNGGGVTNLSGNGSICYLDAPITFTANSTFGSIGGTEIFNGIIADGGSGFSLSIFGTGTNLLTATNTYSGITSVQGTFGLTGHGSIYNSPVIIVTNGAAFDVSGLAIPFSGANALWVGDDVLGQGTFVVGATIVTNFNYLSISNAILQIAVANPGAPCITVTNLNLGDGGAGSTINITSLLLLTPAQIPLIKYANRTGTYSLSLGSVPNGYSATLVDNAGNHSIDLNVTALPPGIWNGGSATGNNWSDAANWSGSGLSGNDALIFTGVARLNNYNDLAFTENAVGIAFLPGAGAFTLNGNPIALAGGITNGSSNLQTINLGMTFGGSSTNFTFDGGTGGLVIGDGLTNAFASSGYTVTTFAGSGTLTNLLNSVPGSGTNVFLMSSADANWTLADNASSTPMTVPWDFQINAGTFNFGVGASAPVLTNVSLQGVPQDNQVGNISGATATLNFSNGTWTTVARLNTALANNSTGIVNQVGGTLNIGNQFQGANGGTSNALSQVNVSGGTLNIGGGAGTFYIASRDQGSLTVSGSAAVNCGTLDIARNANGNTRGANGEVNLNGGVLTVNRVGTATANSQAGPASSGVNPAATFNFNGGTLKAGTNSASFFQGSTVAPIIPITSVVKAGGAIIDDGGFAITILEPLQHDSALGATADGGFTKNGPGTNTLTAACTYTGPTVVSNGTLVIAGSLAAASAVTVTPTATLSGTGTIGGAVTVNGAISPGLPGTNGLLTCSGNVALNGTSLMKIDKINFTNDMLSVGGALTYGGTLNVAVLSGAPALNDSFKLFSAGSYGGDFATTNLPPLNTGLAWRWNPANGTLSVVSGVNPNPTNILASVSGGILTLSWPSDHTGWTLQCQTNGVGAGLNVNSDAWFTVPGSTGVDTVDITIDPTQPTVFYRLKL